MATAPNDYADGDDPDAPAVEVMGSRRHGIAGVIETRLYGLLDTGRGELVNSLDSLVQLVEDLAGAMGSRDGKGPAGLAHQAVDTIAEIRDSLRDRPIEMLVDDGRELVRRQPEIAIGAAVLAGFLAARLVKANR